MKVVFLKRFSKDLEMITRSKDLKALNKVISLVRDARDVGEIPGVKKLTGFNDAFRIRFGDYRIGVFVEGQLVIFARVAHRKDIYKLFP